MLDDITDTEYSRFDSLQYSRLFDWSINNVATSTKKSTSVTRIKASDTKAPAKAVRKAKAIKKAAVRPVPKAARPFVALGGYFKGAWFELRQVRWPNRKATWSLTGAVILFTAFFVVLIVLLDVLFKYLFELILK